MNTSNRADFVIVNNVVEEVSYELKKRVFGAEVSVEEVDVQLGEHIECINIELLVVTYVIEWFSCQEDAVCLPMHEFETSLALLLEHAVCLTSVEAKHHQSDHAVIVEKVGKLRIDLLERKISLFGSRMYTLNRALEQREGSTGTSFDGNSAYIDKLHREAVLESKELWSEALLLSQDIPLANLRAIFNANLYVFGLSGLNL